MERPDIIELKNTLAEDIISAPEDPEAIQRFRSACMSTVKDMSRMDEEGLTSDELKAGIYIISECCRSRVCTKHGNGCVITFVSVLSGRDRSLCAEVYDRWLKAVRRTDRMYMPDALERCAPDREKLTFLLKSFLNTKSDSSVKAQKESQSFNRLFGGRG